MKIVLNIHSMNDHDYFQNSWAIHYLFRMIIKQNRLTKVS